MIKKFTDNDLGKLSKQLIQYGVPAYPDNRHRLMLDSVDQLPVSAVIEPAENPEPDTKYQNLGVYLGIYKQFHIFTWAGHDYTPGD